MNVFVLALVATTVSPELMRDDSVDKSRIPQIVFARVMPDKRAVLAVTDQKTVYITRVGDLGPLRQFKVSSLGTRNAFDLSPDGRKLVVGHETGVDVWDTVSGQKCAVGVKACGVVSGVLVSPSGKWLLVDQEIRAPGSNFILRSDISSNTFPSN